MESLLTPTCKSVSTDPRMNPLIHAYLSAQKQAKTSHIKGQNFTRSSTRLERHSLPSEQTFKSSLSSLRNSVRSFHDTSGLGNTFFETETIGNTRIATLKVSPTNSLNREKEELPAAPSLRRSQTGTISSSENTFTAEERQQETFITVPEESDNDSLSTDKSSSSQSSHDIYAARKKRGQPRKQTPPLALPESEPVEQQKPKSKIKNLRPRDFQITLSSGKDVVYGLPFQKYGKYILKDSHLQQTVILPELDILHQNARTYKLHLEGMVNAHKFLTLMKTESQSTYNRKFEDVITMMNTINQILAWKNEKSKEDHKYVWKLPKGLVIDEPIVFSENIDLYENVYEKLSLSMVEYQRMVNTNHPAAFGVRLLKILFQFMARSRMLLSELTETFEFFKKFSSEKSQWLNKSMPFFQRSLDISKFNPSQHHRAGKRRQGIRQEFTFGKPKKAKLYPKKLISEIQFSIKNPSLSFEIKEQVLNQKERIEKMIQESKKRRQLTLKPTTSTKSLNSTFSTEHNRTMTSMTDLKNPHLFRNFTNIYPTNLSQKLLRKSKYPKPKTPRTKQNRSLEAIKSGSKILDITLQEKMQNLKNAPMMYSLQEEYEVNN